MGRFLHLKCRQPVAIDLDLRSLEMLKETAGLVELVNANALNLPIRSGAADAALLLDVLEHVPAGRETQIIDELWRILKPSGLLLLSVPHQGAFSFLDGQNIRARLRCRLSRETAHRHYSFEQIDSLLYPRFERVRFHFGGGFVYPIAFSLDNFFRRRLRIRLTPFWERVRDWDFSVSWGRWSYNLIILARRATS